MAWSAAVRKGATSSAGTAPAPAPRLQLDPLSSCADDSSIAVAVLDANALISFESSARLLSLAFSSLSSQSVRFVTVKEVVAEVRDPASRFYLATLPCLLDCIDPSDEALQKVIKFSRQTGDLASLSDVDLKLLALTYMLEEQAYGSTHLRSRPPPVHVAQVRHMRERDLPGWGSNVQNLEEWEQLSQEPDCVTDEGSHILGLRKLSLNTSEQENIVSDEDHEHVEQEAQSSVVQRRERVHCVQEVVRSNHEEDSTFVLREDEHDNAIPPTLVNDHCENMSADVCNEEEHEATLQNMEEQENEDRGEWQRAISRSTRRKHEKRAARAAMNPNIKQDVENIESKDACDRVLQADDVNSDEICSCTGIENGSLREATLDEISDTQDGEKSNGDGRSISETCAEEVKQTLLSQDTESEASWALRPLSQSKVACVTADFPMQNVLLQIGLRVVSPNGLQIQQLHRWALKCEACRNVTSDVSRIFCPKCGNGGTLYKVSITVGPNGVIHMGTRKRFNIRGTKYSLPLPKGGRQGVAENPILREDQLPKKMLHPKKRVSIPDLTSPAEMFEMRSGAKEKTRPPVREALAIFSGKRNPNRPRPKQRG